MKNELKCASAIGFPKVPDRDGVGYKVIVES